MLYKCVKRSHNFWGRFYFYFISVFSIRGAFYKTIILLAHVGYEMVTANVLGTTHVRGIIVNLHTMVFFLRCGDVNFYEVNFDR